VKCDFRSVDKESDWEVWLANKEKQARTNLLLYMAWRYLSMQNSGKAVKLTMLFCIECAKDPKVVNCLFSRTKFYGVQDQLKLSNDCMAAIEKEPVWVYLVNEDMYLKVKEKFEQLVEPVPGYEEEEVPGTQPTYINLDEEPSQLFQASPDILASQMDIDEDDIGEKEKERKKKKKRKHIPESEDEEGGKEAEATPKTATKHAAKGKVKDNQVPSNKDKEEGSEEEFPDVEEMKPVKKAKAPATHLAKCTKVTTSQPPKV
ncbi:uncharacterized protein ACA1_064770, partial [Acanthamoeba castellanii str. Neff]